MRHILLTIALAFALAAPALAQKTAALDLSGTWILNPAKSKIDKHGTAGPETIVINCSDSGIQMEITWTGGKESHTWIPDGKDHVRNQVRDQTAAGLLIEKAHWTKGVLVTELISRVSMPGASVDGYEPIHATERWTLSADGSTLTRNTDDPRQTLVYDKQPPLQ